MKKLAYIILTGVIWGFFSCKSQESIYEEYLVPNGLTYPGPVENVVAKPGNERIEIAWKNSADPKVVKARIFWNNYTEFVEVDIDPNMDVDSHIINPIEENTYSFVIRTYDAKDNVSIPVEVMGAVYGEGYAHSLPNRILRNRFYDGQSLTLEWAGAAKTETGVSLNFTDTDGENQHIVVDRSETTTLIPDFDVDHPLVYSTMYMPDSLAIDIFYAPKVETTIDATVLVPKPWTEYILPGDIRQYNAAFPIRNIWNGTLTGANACFYSQENQPLPCTFTWDMGVNVILKRMRLLPRDSETDRWTRGHPKVFEIYGSQAPNPDGSLDGSWLPLGRFECVKPSSGTTITQEDLDLARDGIDFEFVKNEFADPDVAVRYIRFRAISTFGSETLSPVAIQEISFWGKLVK